VLLVSFENCSRMFEAMNLISMESSILTVELVFAKLKSCKYHSNGAPIAVVT